MQDAFNAASQWFGSAPQNIAQVQRTVERTGQQLGRWATEQAKTVERSAPVQEALRSVEQATGVAWRAGKTLAPLAPVLARANPLAPLVEPLTQALARTPVGQQLSREANKALAKTPVAQALQRIDQRLGGQALPLTPQLGGLSTQAADGGAPGLGGRAHGAAERALLQERSRYITEVAQGEKNVVQRTLDGLRAQWTYVTSGQRDVRDDAVKNFDASLQRIRDTGQLFQAGSITAPAVQTQVQQTGQAFIKEHARVQAVQAKQLEWGMAAANVTRDVSAVVAATGVTIGTGGNVFLGAAAGYGVKELGDLAIEGVGSTGGSVQRQMTADRSWVYHLATQAPSGKWGGWKATGNALRREGGDLAWSTVDAVGANYIAKATTTLALRWAPQLFKGGAAANPALKLEFLARGGYEQALPGLLILQKASTVLASATAASTWQLRRGIGETAATTVQVAEQGELFTAQGRKTVGDKAFEQLVALPFASLSTGAAALLPNAGRFAIPSQALSDTGFGVLEGQITTLQREGRGMTGLELFTRTYASGLGSANNLILHPNNLPHAAARTAATPADPQLPALDGLTPRQRGQVIAEQMREAIAQHRTESGDPSRLSAVLAWANEGASIRGPDGRTSRRAWNPTDRAAYVTLGAEINWLLSNPNLSAARGAVSDHATVQPSGPSALVRAADAAVAGANTLDSARSEAAGPPLAHNSSRPFVRRAQYGTDAGAGAPETNAARPGTARADATAPLSEVDKLLNARGVPRSIDPASDTHKVASGMRMAMEPAENPRIQSTPELPDSQRELNRQIFEAQEVQHFLRPALNAFLDDPDLRNQIDAALAAKVDVRLSVYDVWKQLDQMKTLTSQDVAYLFNSENELKQFNNDETAMRIAAAINAAAKIQPISPELIQRFEAAEAVRAASISGEAPIFQGARLFDASLERVGAATAHAVDAFLKNATPQEITDARSDTYLANNYPDIVRQLAGASEGRDIPGKPVGVSSPGRGQAPDYTQELGTIATVASLVEALTRTIPQSEAELLQRQMEERQLAPELAWVGIGKLVQQGGVAAMLGYRLLDSIPPGNDDFNDFPVRRVLPQDGNWINPGGTASTSEYPVLNRQEPPQQQQQPTSGYIVKGKIAADRIDRLLGSFPAPPPRQLNLEGPAPHLRVRSSVGGSRDRISVDNNKLDPVCQEALDRLAQRLGSPQQVNEMLRSLVVGYVSKTGQEEAGLRALAEAWREAQAARPSWPSLTGSTLADLGRVLFNDPKFGSLGDLQALVAIDDSTSGFRGIQHPKADEKLVSPWINPAGVQLSHYRDLTPDDFAQQIATSPWFLDRLRKYQESLDRESAQLKHTPQQPWSGSSDPGFKTTTASREAFWLTLWSAGLNAQALRQLPDGARAEWSDALGVAPALGNINFAGRFIEIHDAMQKVVPQNMGEYDKRWGRLQLEAAVLRLAENTFGAGTTNEGNVNNPERERLRESLVAELRYFANPQAIELYRQSREFERHALRLASGPLLGGIKTPIVLPWVQAAALERLEAIARTPDFQAKVGVTEGTQWLMALGELATSQADAPRQARESLVDQALLMQHSHIELLGALNLGLARSGIKVNDLSTPSAETLDEAVLKILDRAGIRATLTPASDGQPRVFVVEPLPGYDDIMGLADQRTPSWSFGLAGFDPRSSGEPITPAQLIAAMDNVVNTLTRAGPETKWRYRSEAAGQAASPEQPPLLRVHRQPEQPQQQPSTSDGWPSIYEVRLRRTGFFDRLPEDLGKEHLRTWPDDSLTVSPDALRLDPRAAFDLLVEDLGGGNIGKLRLNRMVNALVMGEGGEIGLRALAKAWHAASNEGQGPGWPRLTGTRIVRIGQVIFNDGAFGTLRDLEALWGTQTGTYHGILHPSKDAEANQADTQSEPTSNFRVGFWHPLVQQGLDVRELSRILIDSAASSQDIFMLGARPATRSEHDGIEWALAVSQYPHLADLDFAELFGANEAQRSSTSQVKSGNSRTTWEDLSRGVTARSLADKTFTTPALQDALSEHLLRECNDPADMNGYSNTRSFKDSAEKLALEHLLTGAGLDMPSVVNELRSEVRTLVEKNLGRPAAEAEAGAWLRALEDLVMSPGDDAVMQRTPLLAAMKYKQLQEHTALLMQTENVLEALGLGTTPFNSVPSETGTFRDAMLETLGRFGIVARLEQAAEGHPQWLVVEPRSDGTPADDSYGRAERRFPAALDFVVGVMTWAGYPTNWRLEGSEPPHGGS